MKVQRPVFNRKKLVQLLNQAWATQQQQVEGTGLSKVAIVDYRLCRSTPKPDTLTQILGAVGKRIGRTVLIEELWTYEDVPEE